MTLGSDHHVAVEMARQRRMADEVSQIQLTSTLVVPVALSTGGQELRRQLFPPVPPHHGMDEQAAVMNQHYTWSEIWQAQRRLTWQNDFKMQDWLS